MVDTAEQVERELVAATGPAIEKHRKADARIRVLDAAGRAVVGAKITAEQTGHDFLFGCNIYTVDSGAICSTSRFSHPAPPRLPDQQHQPATSDARPSAGKCESTQVQLRLALACQCCQSLTNPCGVC
jgi:hypothetical protein